MNGKISAARARQAGMSIIEFMIVTVISLVLMAGALTIVFGTRQNFTAQAQLATLQDNERMAMTVITNLIQTGGYFPDPLNETQSNALPAGGNFANAGQALYGVAAGNGISDQLYVRYLAGTSDGVMDCLGQTNAGAASQIDVNQIYVNTATQQLYCVATDGTSTAVTKVLATGVTGMTVNYGVATAGGLSAVEYLPTSAMTAANWPNVVSVQVTLSFTPTATASGANMFPSTNGVPLLKVNLTRTVDLFNRV